MVDYIIWSSHGEVYNGPSVCELREQYIMDWRQQHGESSSQGNPTMDILDDIFHCPDGYEDILVDHSYRDDAYEKYTKLMTTEQTPIYDGSSITILDSILESMRLKVDNVWSDHSFDGHQFQLKNSMPKPNLVPGSYQEVKKILKDMGLGYDIIHSCLYGCVLYYKEFEHLNSFSVCEEPRYVPNEENIETPQRVLRYFPLIPRLRRLFMSSKIAKEMQWHTNRIDSDVDLRHPADGEAGKEFDKEFPEFAREIRNVRLGLATDGFNHFGATSVSYSTWPVVVMPLNLPPSMCMKKEFNMLSLLISGPKSPGKCLSVFLRPLIDELKILWTDGVPTYDRHNGSSFIMRAAVLWTISDFPGLGMLGGIKTKGYMACPLCLDEIQAEYLVGTMSYQGHCRWLDKNHIWRRAADKFNGLVESRDAPKVLSGREVLSKLCSHQYPPLSMKLKPRGVDHV